MFSQAPVSLSVHGGTGISGPRSLLEGGISGPRCFPGVGISGVSLLGGGRIPTPPLRISIPSIGTDT